MSYLFFDLETTGTDVVNSRIVSIAMSTPDGKQWGALINPCVPIPKEATEVHGITDEMVKQKPTFSKYAKMIYDLTMCFDLAGFNIMRFDVPLLQEELLRVNMEYVLRSDINYYDAYAIYAQYNKRDLISAVKHYCGIEFTDAHDAMSDVTATIDVYKQQLATHDLVTKTKDELTMMSKGNKNTLDFSGFFERRDDGKIYLAKGKAAGSLASKERGYLEWIISDKKDGSQFPYSTLVIAKNILNGKM